MLEIKVDGNKISIVSNGPGKPINAVVGGEFDEIMPDGKEFRVRKNQELSRLLGIPFTIFYFCIEYGKTKWRCPYHYFENKRR